MAAKRFAIGQVIFVFLPTKYVLLPVKVVEENIIRTVSGESTAYRVTYGASESPATTHSLEKVTGKDGQVFVTLEEARMSLMAAAKSTIGKIIDDVAKSAMKWYGERAVTSPKERETETHNAPPFETLSAHVTETHIVLPDGSSARLKVG